MRLRQRIRALLDADPVPRWGLAESLVLLLWCAAAGFAVAQHVPWADEEQAWLLAGGVGWKMLFLHSLHYEGTGGLWHALLKLLQALGFSFTGMRWIVAGVEAAAMAVLLRYSPLPRAVRWLLPFTFFLLYQDAVVARSYCLFAIFAFPAAALLRSERARPLLLAVLLGLMANISVHAAIASGGLAIVGAVLWRGRLLRNAPAMLCLGLLWALAIFSMAPAKDIDYQAGNNIMRSTAKVENALGMHVAIPLPLTELSMAGLKPTPEPVHTRHGLQSTWHKLTRTLSVITYPLAQYRWLALLLAACLVAQAVLARQKMSLMPWALIVLVFTSLYLAPRHVGVVFIVFVVSAWLGWPTGAQGARLLLSRATAALFAAACLLQIGWTAHALLREHKLPYAPGRMTAAYLKSRGVPRKQGTVAGYYYLSIGPLLYFDRNIYLNQPPHRYWHWSTTMRTYSTVEDVLRARPKFIIIGGAERGPDQEITRDWEPITPHLPGVTLGDVFHVQRYFHEHGYRTTHVFCGHSWMRSSYAEQLCDTVLEPSKRG